MSAEAPELTLAKWAEAVVAHQQSCASALVLERALSSFISDHIPRGATEIEMFSEAHRELVRVQHRLRWLDDHPPKYPPTEEEIT